jgi:hypothetical protein
MEVFIPIAILLGLGLVYWLSTVYEKKRREKLIELAQTLELQISWELAPQDKERFEKFPVATMGHRQHVKTVLCADTGETRMVVFDFEYTKGHGKNRVNRVFSMALCTNSRLRAPKLALQPESWGTSLAAMVGVQDIDFAEDPAFSSAFQLQGSDEEAIRQFLNETRRKALLSHPTMRLEIDGDSLLVWMPHFRLNADSVRMFMSQALDATNIILGE